LVSDTTINIVKANKSEYKYDLSICKKTEKERESEVQIYKGKGYILRNGGNHREVCDPEKLSPLPFGRRKECDLVGLRSDEG